MGHKITLKELSQLLNISVSTVSKSLNNSPEISENTKNRVKEAAILNHYIPNAAAKNLKKQETGSIGVVVPSIRSPFFSEVLQGIEGKARKLDYKVIICISHESLAKEESCIEKLIQSQVDGIILSPAKETQASQKTNHLTNLNTYGIPLVIFDRLMESIECDKISIEDALHAELAVNELFQAGSRKIAFVSNSSKTSIHQQRKLGYMQAMKILGLTPITLEFEDKFPSNQLLNNVYLKKIDGILGCTESVAIRSMKHLLQAGVQIPEDVAVIGFANSSMSRHFVPSLSAIDQQATLQGELAMETLAYRITGSLPNEMMTYKLEAEIIHRQSTRKIKGRTA